MRSFRELYSIFIVLFRFLYPLNIYKILVDAKLCLKTAGIN